MDNNTRVSIGYFCTALAFLFVVGPMSYCSYQAIQSDNNVVVEKEKTKQLQITARK